MIKLSQTKRIAFGVFCTFLMEKDSPDVEKGVTYRVSEDAVQNFKLYKDTNIITIKLEGEIIAVTVSEATQLGEKEVNCEWYRVGNI